MLHREQTSNLDHATTGSNSTVELLQTGARVHEQLANIQRTRILCAMVDVITEHGAGNVTVAHIVSRSGVSRRTFYELFADREDCFLAAFDDSIEKIAASCVPPYETGRSWPEKIRAALCALLEFLERERGIGRLVVVETLGAGPRALEHRSRVLAQVIAAVEQGGREVKRGEESPPLAAEGVVGAVLSVIHRRLLPGPLAPAGPRQTWQPSPEALVDLVNPLMAMIVLPYLGPSAARRELVKPPPAGRDRYERTTGNPLDNIEMRLTYRTVRVLMAIGSHPGVSNRRVGEAAGIADQGQTSKLLARLRHAGLIENAGFGQAKGESNSWRLTERGGEIEGAIREQTERR
jgi:AcrR family transcriptional regulator/DNA-binding MarR family transcriptional regulator